MPISQLTVLIIDPSGSRIWQRDETKEAVVKYASGWSATADAGDRLEIVGFSTKNPYGYIKLLSYELRLSAPAFKARQKAQEEIGVRIAKAFEELEWSTHSPILEIFNRLADNYGNSTTPWKVIFFTDLMQNSKKLSLNPEFLAKHKDSELLERMKELCPVPPNPAREIAVYYFPGLVKPGQAVEVDSFQRVRKVFRTFLTGWQNKGGKLSFINLEEVK